MLFVLYKMNFYTLTNKMMLIEDSAYCTSQRETESELISHIERLYLLLNTPCNNGGVA